jgi:hypothetical protein
MNTKMTASPADITFIGDAQINTSATLMDFWRWGFSDLCDDDLKGIFAEWMVANLLGLPINSSRRVSWADNDIILPNGKSVEVKSTAVWQSWKLVNHDGTRKPMPPVAEVKPENIRFAGLQSRSNVFQWSGEKSFKSNFYVFCFHRETDPAAWDAWNLSQWEFYRVTREELAARNVGPSISLRKLRDMGPAIGPMSAAQFQSLGRIRFGI